MTTVSDLIPFILVALGAIGLAVFSGYRMGRWKWAILLGSLLGSLLTMAAIISFTSILYGVDVLFAETALVTTGLAAALGYRMGKWRGAIFLGLLLVMAAIICFTSTLYGVHGLLATTALVTLGLVATFGYFMSKWMGAIILFSLSILAATICFVGASLYRWPGFIAAMIAVTTLVALPGRAISGRRGALCFSLTWVGWCVFCIFGYLVAGTSGLWLITLPALSLFGIGAYVLAQVLLPLRDNATRQDRLKAFRALLTYTFGTNYPYYAVENREAKLRTPGNSFRSFLAGPGIIITSCDHTVVLTNNFKITLVPEPGLTFTGVFESIKEVIDLRIQQRAFPVEAITKDGIRIKVTTFGPFRIDAGENVWPELGKPFPFRKSAVFKAVQASPVERSLGKKEGKVVEGRQKRVWHEVYGIVGAQIVRQIIAQYTFDDLCAPYQPAKDPRQDIGKELKKRLEEELAPLGIQAMGGGISDLMPVDDKLLQRRIDNWRAEWERRMIAEVGKGEAEYIRMVESARAQAQAEMIRTISEGFERAGPAESISTEVIALRFVEALEKMISPAVRAALPSGAAVTMEAMKSHLESQKR